ncbi:MAG: sortase, partial [Solirubrobacteraceae bacterium]
SIAALRRPLGPFLGLALIALGAWTLAASRSPSLPAAPTASVTAAPAIVEATRSPAAPTARLTGDLSQPIPDGYRVQIPRLGIDLPIQEGVIQRDIVDQQTPEQYAFRLPLTGIPGFGTNTYLYAHARRGMFLSLWEARPGDEVFVSTPDGRALKYVVSEVHSRVQPTDMSWLQRTPTERLTLQTSTGANSGDPRFVVVALPAVD